MQKIPVLSDGEDIIVVSSITSIEKVNGKYTIYLNSGKFVIWEDNDRNSLKAQIQMFFDC